MAAVTLPARLAATAVAKIDAKRMSSEGWGVRESEKGERAETKSSERRDGGEEEGE